MRFITLLTDFGLKDASAAIARSILMQKNPGAEILEITHAASNEYLIEAAYILASSYAAFPKGTCHVLYVGIYHSKTPSLVLCEKDGHYFLAPNNGILPLALGLENLSLWQCYTWEDKQKTFRDWQEKCAEIALLLSAKTPEELGFPHFMLDPVKQHKMPAPVVSGNSVDCQILHISHNGNVVVNMQRQQFENMCAGRSFRIELRGSGYISHFSEHIGMVNEKDVLCRFNKADYLEIAINGGPAAKLLGFSIFSDKQQFYSTVKITFE